MAKVGVECCRVGRSGDRGRSGVGGARRKGAAGGAAIVHGRQLYRKAAGGLGVSPCASQAATPISTRRWEYPSGGATLVGSGASAVGGRGRRVDLLRDCTDRQGRLRMQSRDGIAWRFTYTAATLETKLARV